MIVNDMSEINIDAQLIRHTEEKLIQLSNGCICCTLREDLLQQLVELTKDGNNMDAIIIESTGISEPIHVAETFAHSSNLEFAKNLGSIVRLDTMCTVVDSSNFLQLFHGSNRSKITDTNADGTCSVRTINDLLLDQIQFANVIVLNKTDSLESPQHLKDLRSIVAELNPIAKIVEASFGKVSVSSVVNTRLFSFKESEKNAEWFKTSWGESVPETEEYGISSFVFRKHIPFHPERLFDVLQLKSSSLLSESSEMSWTLKCIIRDKGFLWLASRHENYALIHMVGGGIMRTSKVGRLENKF